MKNVIKNISNAVNPLINKANRKATSGASSTKAEPEFTTQMGVPLMVKPRPEGNHACKRCKGTGTRVYISKKDSETKWGDCFNCHGVGHLTPAQVKEVTANAKAGVNTMRKATPSITEVQF